MTQSGFVGPKWAPPTMGPYSLVVPTAGFQVGPRQRRLFRCIVRDTQSFIRLGGSHSVSLCPAFLSQPRYKMLVVDGLEFHLSTRTNSRTSVQALSRPTISRSDNTI